MARRSRRRSRRRGRSQPPKGWLWVGEVAEMARVKREAIHAWVKRPAQERWTGHHGIYGRRLYLSPEMAEEYLNRRGVPTAEPPAGYVSIYDYSREHGLSHNRLLGHCYRGELPCVRYKRKFWAPLYQLRRIAQNPLPEGWVWAEDAARALGLSRGAMLKRLHTRCLPVRRILGRGAVRWLDAVQLREIVPPDAVPAQRIALQAGVTREAVTSWARRHRRPVYYVYVRGHRMAALGPEDAERYLRAHGVGGAA